MPNELAHDDGTPGRGREWKQLLLLAFVGLPISASLCLCVYGFTVWFMQLFFWGPPH